MKISLLPALLALLIAPNEAQDAPSKPAPAAEKEKEEEEIYIPKDLDDAVRELNKHISDEDKERIRKGEIDGGDMHFGPGMSLRNRWGLWGGSRLARWFKDHGIKHPDSMSGYILDAFCRNLKGQEYDLLLMVRANARDWPGPPSKMPILIDGEPLEGKAEAVLFMRYDYDEKKRIVCTTLLWHPDDGRIYLERGTERRLAKESEIEAARKEKEYWNFTAQEQEVLEALRKMNAAERLARIKAMSEDQRAKVDGVLPRAKDPAGLDKPQDPFGEPDDDRESAEKPVNGSDSKAK